MSTAAIAQRYAQAIFDLGNETSSVSGLVQDIRLMAEAYEGSPEMRAAAASPLIVDTERLAAIREIAVRLGVSPLAKNAVCLLTQRRRLTLLPEIARELGRLEDERAGVARVVVTSAKPLTETYAARLQRELEATTGKRVVMDRRLDPDLLAGVVVKIGDRIVDGSARAQLQELRSQLLS